MWTKMIPEFSLIVEIVCVKSCKSSGLPDTYFKLSSMRFAIFPGKLLVFAVFSSVDEGISGTFGIEQKVEPGNARH